MSDLALIERLRLAFGPGLNVITGETGAGKSLVIDALGLVRGARADTTLIRHGTDAARVEALFDRLPEPLIAVREVATGGRSTARLDDLATTASRLADEVGPLVEIHGQHDQQRLLDERWQRDLLDAYGGHGRARAAMADVVGRWRANRAALAELSIDPRELARRVDLLEHEVEEIAGARLRPGEADEIRARLAAAQHGEAIARGAAAVREALTAEGPDGSGARDVTAMAAREARGLARLDPRFEAARRAPGRARGGAGRRGRRGPRPGRCHRARPGHPRGARGAPGHDLRARAAIRRRRDRGDRPWRSGPRPSSSVCAGSTRSAPAASARTPSLLEGVAPAAGALSEARRTAGNALAAAVGGVLEELGFPPGVFEVALGRRVAAADEPAIELDGDAVAFDATGADQVVYRLAPNPGEPAGRWRGSPRAANCRGSPWPSRASWPRPTRRRSSSSTRSTPGSGVGARTRSGAASGRWRAGTRSCA